MQFVRRENKMCRNVVERICLSKIKKALKKNDFRNDCHVREKDTEREHIALWGDNKYKYLEKIVWNADKMQCVAVGFNPTCNKIGDIDSTNRKLIEALEEKGFGGYFLLNLYPQRSRNRLMFDENDQIGKIYHTLLPAMLKDIFKRTDLELIVFWGKTAVIEEPIVQILQKFGKNNRLWITIKKGSMLHYHPSHIDIDIAKFDDDFSTATYQFIGKTN